MLLPLLLFKGAYIHHYNAVLPCWLIHPKSGVALLIQKPSPSVLHRTTLGQVVPTYIWCQVVPPSAFCLPLLLFPVLGCHSVNLFVHLLSSLLTTCPPISIKPLLFSLLCLYIYVFDFGFVSYYRVFNFVTQCSVNVWYLTWHYSFHCMLCCPHFLI